MAGAPQLQYLNLQNIDRAAMRDRMFDMLANRQARTPEDDAFDAWAAKQGAEEAKVSLDEFGGTKPSYGDDDWLSKETASLFGSLISGYFGSRAANRAVDAQSYATKAATEEQRRQYDQNRTDLAPYRNRAAPARNQLAVMMGLNPDTATYGAGNPQRDPLWMKGYQAAPKYTSPQQPQNALSRYLQPRRG